MLHHLSLKTVENKAESCYTDAQENYIGVCVLKGELLSATYSRVAGRWRSVDGDEDGVYVSPISSSTLRGVSASCDEKEPQLQ